MTRRMIDLLIPDGGIAVLANALIVTFVISFIVIVVFGHIMLIAAIWPNLRRKKPEPQQAPDTEPARYSALSN